MKPIGLRELTDEFSVTAVAKRAPGNWKEAVAAYAADRTGTLKADWSVISEFDAEKRRLEIAAVAMIATRLKADVKKPPTLKIKPESAREATQNKIDLAALLCPDGWPTLYAPVLDQLAGEVEASFLKGEEIKKAQAVTREIKEFERFLLKTEAAGRQAAFNQQQAPRASGARDPRQSGAVRPVM